MTRHPTIIWIHWLVAALVTAGVASVLWRETLDDTASRRWFLDLHRSVGLSVLALTAFRLGARLLTRAPEHNLPPILRAASTMGHMSLYALLIALPVVGWVQSSANVHTFKIFGMKVFRLAAYDPDLADQLRDLHRWLGWTLIGLVSCHIAAALYHALIRRDGVLQSMLPPAGGSLRR